MILVAYRHGLRGVRACGPALGSDQVDIATATMHVRRVKQGSPRTHPILGDELRSLRRLQREQEPKSPFVFTSERGAPFSTAGLPAWSSGWAQWQSWVSRRIRTCCGMLAVLRWLPRGTTLGRSRLTSGTKTSSAQCATRSCHRRGSRRFGGTRARETGWQKVYGQFEAHELVRPLGVLAFVFAFIEGILYLTVPRKRDVALLAACALQPRSGTHPHIGRLVGPSLTMAGEFIWN